MGKGHNKLDKLSASGLVITLGIIFGDLGTSPLYVLKAVVGEHAITAEIVKGAISCIFWTLTLQTTLKYVVLTLRADNKGEGGVFSLYTLVKRMKIKWLLFPAIIGGSALLADGIITPSITVTSAIEGLTELNPNVKVVPIVLAIITGLFIIQQFGTKSIGKFFGPAMFFWFLMIGILGIIQIVDHAYIFSSINPYYAYVLLSKHPDGFLVLGAVFLCTTGAEALYSDLGHCGLKNIRTSWVFVKIMLLLNYLGQGAWLIQHKGMTLQQIGIANPFFGIMADWFVPIGVVIATLAAIIASQALISGSFTLVSEAMRLNLWMKMKIKYPTSVKGQLYIPSINWTLYIGCIFIVLHFQESSGMEAAYGLAIVLSMITTTILLMYYMTMKKYSKIFIFSCALVYGIIEISFLYANMGKFFHGGWITIFIATILVGVMLNFHYSQRIRRRYAEFVKLPEFLPILEDLSKDMSVPKYATHLVYLTSADKPDEIESKIIYSILHQQPKRADIYWFVHVNVVDEPYRMEYKVNEFVHDDIIRVDFTLGFRVEPRINVLFKKVVEDMVENKEVDITSRYQSLYKNNVIGDFRFVVIQNILSYDNELPIMEKFVMDIHGFFKYLSLSAEKAFGLDSSSVTVEKAPMVLSPLKNLRLTRVK
jgi:KUP system potassium uptake protein